MSGYALLDHFCEHLCGVLSNLDASCLTISVSESHSSTMTVSISQLGKGRLRKQNGLAQGHNGPGLLLPRTDPACSPRNTSSHIDSLGSCVCRMLCLTHCLRLSMMGVTVRLCLKVITSLRIPKCLGPGCVQTLPLSGPFLLLISK